MSRTVSISELKAQLSRYIRAVRRGEVLLVRDRARIVARLEAAGPTARGPDSERLEQLEQTGVLRRRRKKIDPALLRRRVRAHAEVVAALLAERDEAR